MRWFCQLIHVHFYTYLPIIIFLFSSVFHLTIWGKQHLRWKGWELRSDSNMECVFFLLSWFWNSQEENLEGRDLISYWTGQIRDIQIKTVLVLQFLAVLITETQRRMIRYHFSNYFRLWKWIYFLEGTQTTLFLIYVSWEMKIKRLLLKEFFFKYPGILNAFWLIWKYLLLYITYGFVFNNLAGLVK